MSARGGEMVCLAAVAGTRGLRGDIKLRPVSPDAFALLEMRRVVFRKGDGILHRFNVVKATAYKAGILLRLEGVDSISAVEGLVGSDVLVSVDELPDRQDGDFYWSEIEGLTVVDSRLGEVGTIDDIFSTPAHDIYVVIGRFGEVLIPVVDAFIERIDLHDRRMWVDLPEGLVKEVDDV